MKAISDWAKTWTVAEAIVGGIALVCLTAIAIVITVQDDWGKLVHFISSAEGATFATSLGIFLGAVYSRARRLPAAVLLFALLGASVVGCGAGITDAERSAWTVEEAACEHDIDVIVAREETTQAEDEAALAAEQERCHAAHEAILHPDGGVQ